MNNFLNEGRNVIPMPNSDSRCLLENWVEERATKHLAPDDLDGYIKNKMRLYGYGNRCLLTQDTNSPVSSDTSYSDSYAPPTFPKVRTRGCRDVKLEEYIRSLHVNDAIGAELTAPPDPTDYTTTHQVSFGKPGFQDHFLGLPTPTKVHDYTRDQAVTFWTEHRDRVPGVSNTKAGDTPFRKNVAFSTPTALSWDQTQPYDLESYPKM